MKYIKPAIGCVLFVFVAAFFSVKLGDLMFGMGSPDVVDAVQYNVTNADYSIIRIPAHIALDVENCEVLYVDYDNDVAYISDSELPARVGDIVTFVSGIEGTITAVDVYGCCVVPTTPDAIKPGDSGTAVVLPDGTQVGYVSSMYATGVIRVIWT